MKLQSRAVLMFAVLVAILFADVFASATEVTAQAQVPERRTVDEIQTDLDRALSRDKELEQIIQLLNENADIAASPVSKKYNETLISQYEYIIALMKYNEQMLAWELFASSVSLWLVVAIVAAGVGFSGFQLWQAAKTGKPQSTSRLEI